MVLSAFLYILYIFCISTSLNTNTAYIMYERFLFLCYFVLFSFNLTLSSVHLLCIPVFRLT